MPVKNQTEYDSNGENIIIKPPKPNEKKEDVKKEKTA